MVSLQPAKKPKKHGGICLIHGPINPQNILFVTNAPARYTLADTHSGAVLRTTCAPFE